MNRSKQIINKTLSIIGVLLLAGCETNKPDWGKYRGEQHSHTQLETIPYSSSNTTIYKPSTPHQDLPDPFTNEVNSLLVSMNKVGNVNYIKDFVLYQAWDYRHPNVSPAFATKKEAQQYADGNNISDGLPTGHMYVVREIDHRYEVRIGFSDFTYSNGTWRDVIFTSYTLNESEKFLNEQKAYHTDLVIFDLMTTEVAGVNTP
jgi:hypothetical protein